MRTRIPLLLCLLLSTLPTAQATILGDDLAEEEAVPYEHLPRLRLSLEGGFSQWLYILDTEYVQSGKDFHNDIFRGWDLSGDAVYFFHPRGGVGATWIWFLSKAEDADVVFFPDNVHHDMAERVSFVYVGPSLWSRMRLGRAGMLVGGFSVGYLTVLDTWTDNGKSNRVEAENFALVAQVGYDYSIHPHAAVGVNFRFVFSSATEYTFNGKKIKLEKPPDIYTTYNVPLQRLELNLGLRFQL